jgi:hypothetical protein
LFYWTRLVRLCRRSYVEAQRHHARWPDDLLIVIRVIPK